MNRHLSWQERKALYRAGVRFPDPRDDGLRVRSVVLLYKQMVARNILKRRQVEQQVDHQRKRQHLGPARLVVVR